MTHDTTSDIDAKRNATPYVVLLRQSAAGAIAPQVNLWDHWNLRYTLYTVYVSLIHKYYIYICIYIYVCVCVYAYYYLHMHLQEYIYIYTILYIYIYTFKYITFIYIYIYTYTYTHSYIYICGTPPNVHRFCFTSGALALHGGAVRVMFLSPSVRRRIKTATVPKRNIAPEPPTPERSFGVLKFTIPFNHRVSWLCKSHELNNHTPAEIPLKKHVPVMCSAETPKKHHVSCLNSHWNAPADIPVNHHFAWWNHR